MRRLIAVLGLLYLFSAVDIHAQTVSAYNGICESGNIPVTIPGTQGSGNQKFQQSFPACTVTVYVTGTLTLATIYANATLTPLGNPFTAQTTGRFIFFVAPGTYDIQLSGSGLTSPFTISSVNINTPILPGGAVIKPCNGAGDLAAKISSTYSTVPVGNIVDCSALSGPQTLAADPFSAMSQPATVILPAGNLSSLVSLTIPRNVTVRFSQGSIFQPSVGTIITFNGHIDAPFTQIFSTNGCLTCVRLNTPGVPIIYPQWFNAGGTFTDGGLALNEAFNAMPTAGGVVDGTGISQTITQDIFSGVTQSGKFISCGSLFNMSTFITIPSNWEIDGCGASTQFVANTVQLPFTPDSGGSASGILFVGQNSTNIKIHDVVVKGAYTGTGTSSTTFGIRIGTGSTNIHVYNNIVSNNSWSGILMQGLKLTVEKNYVSHNAIDGIESFATDSKILGNTIFDEAAASANGGACIEILPGGARVDIGDNNCISSNHQGIQLTSGVPTPDKITIHHNQFFQPAQRGINDAAGTTNLDIDHNMFDKPQGSGALGDAIYLANSVGFRIQGNTVVGLTTGSGPSGIQVDGTCDDGQILDNYSTGNWVGLSVTGACGTNLPIYIAGNFLYLNMNTDFANSSTGTKVYQTINIIGNNAPIPFFAQMAGGNATTSTLTLTGTTNVGVSTNPAILFDVGTAGATEAGRICNNGHWTLGNTNCSLEYFAIVNNNLGVQSTTTADADINITSSNGSGNQWQILSKNTGHLQLFDNSTATATVELNGAGNFGVAALATATASTLCFDSTTISGHNTLTTCSSLRRLKKDINSLPSSPEEFMRLHPVSYIQKNDGARRWGFIAEEVNAVNPDMSSYYNGELNGVDYNAVVALLVKTVQDQQKEIEEIKKHIR